MRKMSEGEARHFLANMNLGQTLGYKPMTIKAKLYRAIEALYPAEWEESEKSGMCVAGYLNFLMLLIREVNRRGKRFDQMTLLEVTELLYVINDRGK